MGSFNNMLHFFGSSENLLWEQNVKKILKQSEWQNDLETDPAILLSEEFWR